MLDLLGDPYKQKTFKATAFPAMPGTGPEGEICKTCEHAYKRQGGARAYNKCDRVKATHGRGTDLKINSPACSFYEPKTPAI